jgi:hypothetical protein
MAETTVAVQNNTSVVEGYSSIKGTDLKSRKAIYTAVSNADKLSDHLNESLALKDIIIQPVTTENPDTGVVEGYLRTILILEDGTALATGSDGVINSINTLFKSVGEPHQWGGDALYIRVKEVRGNKGYRYMTVELLEDDEVDAILEAKAPAKASA